MQNKYVWAGLSIVAMWSAVAFVGVFGPSMEVASAGGDVVTVPALAIVVAFFAMIGTILVAIFGFRG